jgi:hypothetical protein
LILDAGGLACRANNLCAYGLSFFAELLDVALFPFAVPLPFTLRDGDLRGDFRTDVFFFDAGIFLIPMFCRW